MKRILMIFGSAALLAACAVPTAPAAEHDIPSAESNRFTEAPASDAELLPYPEPAAQEQIEQLGTQLSRLEQQIEQLTLRVQQLERRSGTPKRLTAPPKQKLSPAVQPVSEPHAPSSLQQAQAYYRQGSYKAAAAVLRHADSGGDGSNTARQSMFLLLQSHQKLGNCQSVINIGQRYAAMYSRAPQADEALFAVGQCQWQIQQRDIARDTWRKLQRSYPNSSGARKAAEQLKR